MAKKLTKSKAKEILHDKSVHGHPLTDKQRRFFGAIAGGAKPYKAQIGTMLTGFHPNLAENLSEVLSAPQKAATQLVTGKYQTPSEAMGIQNAAGAFLTDVVLDPLGLMGLGAGAKAAKASTKTGILSKAYLKNPIARKELRDPNKSFRVAGMDAYDDFVESGILRSRTPEMPEGLSLVERMTWGRPTAFPSFQKGYADMRYLPKEGGVVFETSLPTFKRGDINPVTGNPVKGRHYAHRVIDTETGKVLSNVPGKDIKVYKDKPHWLMGYQEIKPPKKKQDGGWLDKYVPKAQNGIEGTMGGLTDKGFNYNGAWGGPSMQMGGVLPGAVGFTYARTAGAAPANGPYAKKTKASAQDGTTQPDLQGAADWYKTWYSQRKALPQFSHTAGKRLELLQNLPQVKLDSLQELDKMDAVAYYEPTKSRNPNEDILHFADPSSVPSFQKFAEERRGAPYEQPISLNIGTHPNVVMHEMGHWLDKRAPQSMFGPIGVKKSEPYQKYPIISPRYKKTGLEEDTYRWITGYGTQGPKTEVNSVLNELRQAEGLRGDQPTTPEQMKSIIDKYMNLPTNKSGKNKPEATRDWRIQTLIKYLEQSPEKLSDINNRIVAAPRKETPTAQNGIKLPVIEDEGRFNKDGVWIPDWEKMTAQAKKLGAKKVKTKHGSVIYFNDKWEVSSVDDNPDNKAQNGAEMSFYQQGLDWKPKTISRNGGWLDKFDTPQAQDGDVLEYLKKTKSAPVVTKGKPLTAEQQKRITAETLNRQTQKNKPLTATNTREQAVERGRAENLRVIKENKEAEAQSIAEGKAAEATRENPNVPFTFPTGESKLWKDMDWREQQYVSGRNLGSMSRFNNWTDWINPITMIGEMGEGLATAPYMARETNSNLPYAVGIGSPLLTGALGGLGTKSVGQFTNNLLNPAAGLNLSSLTNAPAKRSISNLISSIKGLKTKDGTKFTFSDRINTGIQAQALGLATGATELGISGAAKLMGKKTRGRSLGEVFPTTAQEKYAARLQSEDASRKAEQFIKSWNYDESGWVRPEIATKIADITYSGASPSPYARTLNNFTAFDADNPLSYTPNIMTSTRYNEVVSNPKLSQLDRIRILHNRADAAGINFESPNPASYTFTNWGPYEYPYSEKLSTAVHEGAHTMQDLGLENYGFGKALASYDDTYRYWVPNTATEIGKRFADAMPTPRKGKSNWNTSPNELHSELMSARQRFHKILMGEGFDYESAINQLQKNTMTDDATVDELIRQGNLNRFFKKDTPIKERRALIRMLPAAVPAVGAASMLGGESEETPKRAFQDGGDVPVDPMGYWNPENVGGPVIIPSTDITMEGVDQPLIGISDTGDVQYMEPGEDYEFDGEYVTEYPVAKKGISVNNADAQPLKKLDQLLNFTNYNKPTKGGWLDKYN